VRHGKDGDDVHLLPSVQRSEVGADLRRAVPIRARMPGLGRGTRRRSARTHRARGAGLCARERHRNRSGDLAASVGEAKAAREPAFGERLVFASTLVTFGRRGGAVSGVRFRPSKHGGRTYGGGEERRREASSGALRRAGGRLTAGHAKERSRGIPASEETEGAGNDLPHPREKRAISGGQKRRGDEAHRH